MSREQQAIKPATIIIIIVSFFLIISLIRNALGLYQSRSRLEATKNTVSELEKKKQRVEVELKNQTDPSALDQAIRNKLNLSKPGETVLVITDSESGVSVSTTQHFEKQIDAPIREWWQVINPPKP